MSPRGHERESATLSRTKRDDRATAAENIVFK